MNNLQLTTIAYLEELILVGEIDLRNAGYRYSFGVFPYNSDVFLRERNKCLKNEKLFVPCPYCAIRKLSRKFGLSFRIKHQTTFAFEATHKRSTSLGEF